MTSVNYGTSEYSEQLYKYPDLFKNQMKEELINQNDLKKFNFSSELIESKDCCPHSLHKFQLGWWQSWSQWLNLACNKLLKEILPVSIIEPY